MPRRLSKGMEGGSTAALNSSARSLIPIGSATLLPDTAQRIRHLEQMFFDCVGGWGYREIIPPTFEFLDVLSAGLPPETLEKCFKFADWSTGRILVLRPDVTAQIARIVAMGMAGQGNSLRLSYRTTVFRYEQEHAGREREIFQVGAELIGEDSAAQDAEILTLLVESLKNLGLGGFTISLGHVGFFKELLAQSGLSESGRKEAEMAAAGKDMPYLEDILDREHIPQRLARQLLEVPCRLGGSDVLKWGKKLAGNNRRLKSSITRLTQVYGLLEQIGVQDHFLIDLGEFRGFQYYDGMVFDVFTDQLGSELGGGGRYNHLIGRFGRDEPSTGFALDMDRVFAALSALSDEGILVRQQKPVLLVGARRHYGKTFKVAQMLRQYGIPVVQEFLQTAFQPEKFEVMERAMALGVERILVLEDAGMKTKELLVITPSKARSSVREKRVQFSELVSLLGGGADAHV